MLFHPTENRLRLIGAGELVQLVGERPQARIEGGQASRLLANAAHVAAQRNAVQGFELLRWRRDQRGFDAAVAPRAGSGRGIAVAVDDPSQLQMKTQLLEQRLLVDR